MDARLTVRLALAIAIALAPALAVPAAADHVFSHRVYIVGRVVDVDGVPAPGLAVNVTFENIRATSRCFDSKPEVTGPTGDYEVCRHTHAIPANATATVRVGGEERTVAIDPDLRHASASFQLPTPTASHDIHGERTFARTLLVTGRAFELLVAPEAEEGVDVSARPLAENVSVSLRAGDEVLANATARPNEHGLYRVELAVEGIPAGAVVRAVAGADGGEELASPTFRRADVNIVRDHRLAGGPGEEAPGSTTPIGAWLAVAALTLAVVARAPPRSRGR